MFTTFLIATALATLLVLAALLLRPRRDVEPLTIPYGGAAVAAVTLGLIALGLWMV